MSRHATPLVAVFALMLVAAVAFAAARPSPQANPSVTTTETLSAIAETDGWCRRSLGTAPQNIMLDAPSRLTAAEKSRVRYVEVMFPAGVADGGESRACVHVGGDAGITPCDVYDSNTTGVLYDRERKLYAISRDPATGVLQSVWASVDTGTTDAGSARGVVCVDVGF